MSTVNIYWRNIDDSFDSKKQYLIYFRGCFCPPTRGHFELVQNFIKFVNVTVFISQSGNSSRHNVHYNVSKKIWKLYLQLLSENEQSRVILKRTIDSSEIIPYLNGKDTVVYLKGIEKDELMDESNQRERTMEEKIFIHQRRRLISLLKKEKVHLIGLFLDRPQKNSLSATRFVSAARSKKSTLEHLKYFMPVGFQEIETVVKMIKTLPTASSDKGAPDIHSSIQEMEQPILEKSFICVTGESGDPIHYIEMSPTKKLSCEEGLMMTCSALQDVFPGLSPSTIAFKNLFGTIIPICSTLENESIVQLVTIKDDPESQKLLHSTNGPWWQSEQKGTLKSNQGNDNNTAPSDLQKERLLETTEKDFKNFITVTYKGIDIIVPLYNNAVLMTELTVRSYACATLDLNPIKHRIVFRQVFAEDEGTSRVSDECFYNRQHVELIESDVIIGSKHCYDGSHSKYPSGDVMDNYMSKPKGGKTPIPNGASREDYDRVLAAHNKRRAGNSQSNGLITIVFTKFDVLGKKVTKDIKLASSSSGILCHHVKYKVCNELLLKRQDYFIASLDGERISNRSRLYPDNTYELFDNSVEFIKSEEIKSEETVDTKNIKNVMVRQRDDAFWQLKIDPCNLEARSKLEKALDYLAASKKSQTSAF